MSDVALALRYLSWFVLIIQMFVAGLYLTPKDLRNAFKKYKLIIKALIANAIIIPLIGLALFYLTPMSQTVATGFLLVTFSFGVPLALNFVRGLRADIPFVTVMVFALALTTSITMPILLNLLLPVDFSIRRSFLIIFGYVVVFQLVPLLIGTALGSSQRVRRIFLKPFALITLAASLVLAAIFIAVGLYGLSQVGYYAPISMIVLTFASIGVGWLLGGPNRTDRKVLAINSSLRNYPIGLLIAATVFADTSEELSVAVFSVIMLLTVFFFSRIVFRVRGQEKIKQVSAGPPKS